MPDTDAEATDRAVEACPTGSLLRKRVGYATPVGERKFDHDPSAPTSRRRSTDPSEAPIMAKPKLATTSLCGCFGCHMSLLDIDERILELVELVDFDRSPINDIKEITGPVDIGLVEGGCANEENVKVLQEFRKHCKVLISVGDCAINGGIPALRNMVPLKECYDEAFLNGPTVVNPERQGAGRRRDSRSSSTRSTLSRGGQDRLPPARLPAVGRHALGRADRAARRRDRSALPYELVKYD